MRLLRYPLFFLAGLLVLTGCTSTEVISNKDPNFNSQIDKLYVSSRMSEALDDYEASALDALTRTMQGQTLRVLTFSDEYVPESLALDEESAAEANAIPYKEARSAKMSTILVIEEIGTNENRTPSRSIMNADGSMGTLTGSVEQFYSLNASLYDVESEKRVWRAEIKSEGDGYSSLSQEGRVMVESLLEKFVEDGLLPSNFKTNSSAFR